ncbi:MAG: LD-carboxypeptidase [Deltaproteobacteria bacterium]|nr:LD-carboxypeptidase [Deltaproteobacteria bacterium]
MGPQTNPLNQHGNRRKHITKLPVIKPPKLETGDLVGVISPAGPVSESDLQPGLKILESFGFDVRLAPHVYDMEGYLAGKDEARLDDLHAMLQDRDTKAVFCARGGYGSLRLLDRIDYDLIRSNPKILVGFSDITALLMAVHAKTGLVTFHGPMVRGLDRGHQSNWESLLRLLTSDKPAKPDLSGCSVLAPGRAKGPLIGGNLSMICHLLGTPFMPRLDGCILFLEDRGEALYRLDRMLTHLALAGGLKGISGLIAGQFEGCGETADINRLFSDIISEPGIPLVTGFPVGHGKQNLALPLGLTADLDTETMTLTIKEACIR